MIYSTYIRKISHFAQEVTGGYQINFGKTFDKMQQN